MASSPTPQRAERAASPPFRLAAVLRDGLLAGVAGGVAVIAVFAVRDLLAGEPLRTPSTLAAWAFLDGDPAAVEPRIQLAVAWNAVHLLLWIAAGVLSAALFAWVERHPKLWWPVLFFVIFFAVHFVGLDVATDPALLGRFTLTLGGLVGAAVMAWLLWRWHPGVTRRSQAVWEE